MKRIASSLVCWLTLGVTGAVLIMDPPAWAGAAIGSQQTGTQEMPAAAHPQLHLGAQQRSGKDVVTVPLELVLPAGAEVYQIRTEIEMAAGPWKFRKADKPPGSDLKITARQRSQERKTADGVSEKVTVVSLSVIGGDQGLAAGVVAILSFSMESSDAAKQLPLTIREAEFVESSSSRPPTLEPPPRDAPVNPSAGCFFFAH